MVLPQRHQAALELRYDAIGATIRASRGRRANRHSAGIPPS
jgi:hypothetical protein